MVCTCCSSSRARCFENSEPLVRAQSLSSRPSTRRVSACVSSMRPLTLPWSSANFSRPSPSRESASSLESSFRSRAARRRLSSDDCCWRLPTAALTLSAMALTWFCITMRLTACAWFRDDGVAACRPSPGSQALCGLLHIEVVMLVSPPAPGGSRRRLAMRRMSIASARRAGLADLTRLPPTVDGPVDAARTGIALPGCAR
mmetsp:Transcript_54892/g.161379  ORF Transcript_54892/g.161379 Transcript_54892/m.161379 type:complete len:201 (+) Transcript_54892:3949-4551(+)